MPLKPQQVVVAGTAAVIVVTAGLVWWFSPYGEVAERGEAIDLAAQLGPDRFDLDLARDVEVRLPGGTVLVQIGEPVDDLPHGSRTADIGELDDGDYHAPRGADFLPVSWELHPVALVGTFLGDEITQVPSGVTMRITAGDAVVEIDQATIEQVDSGADDVDGLALVVDEDDLDSATVEVTFDGETQTVAVADGTADAGRAAPLYDLGSQETVDILSGYVEPEGRAPRGFAVDGATLVTDVACGPWLPDRGWVEEAGTSWCLIGVQSRIDRTPNRQPESRDGYRYRLTGQALTLDGEAPVEEDLEIGNGDDHLNLSVTGDAVFLVDELAQDVELDHEIAVLSEFGSRTRQEFNMTSTLDVSTAAKIGA